MKMCCDLVFIFISVMFNSTLIQHQIRYMIYSYHIMACLWTWPIYIKFSHSWNKGLYSRNLFSIIFISICISFIVVYNCVKCHSFLVFISYSVCVRIFYNKICTDCDLGLGIVGVFCEIFFVLLQSKFKCVAHADCVDVCADNCTSLTCYLYIGMNIMWSLNRTHWITFLIILFI
jgi:hypothetical protein